MSTSDPSRTPPAQPAPAGPPYRYPGTPGYGTPPYGPPPQAPGQPPQAPGQPPQPPQAPGSYAQPAWGAAPAPMPAAGSRRGLALLAVILGAFPLAMSLFQPFALRAVVGSGNYAVWSLVSLVIGILSLLTGVGAIVFGLLARRDAPLPAGIGIGLGAAAAAGALIGFLYTLVATY